MFWRKQVYGFTVTTTTSWEGTFAENLPANFPRSLWAQRSRMLAERCSGYPSPIQEAVISASDAPRLSSSTARLPSSSGLDQTSIPLLPPSVGASASLPSALSPFGARLVHMREA